MVTELAWSFMAPRLAALTAWFEVSCCPTNVARTLASVASYFATADDDGVQLHQYGDLDVDTTLPDGRNVALRVRTGYPFDDRIAVTADSAGDYAVSLRIPAWSRDRARAALNGEEVPIVGDILTMRRTFRPGDEIVLDLDVAPRFTVSDTRIDAVRGTVAVERGPLVLCLESVDLPEGTPFADVRVDPRVDPRSTARGASVALVVDEDAASGSAARSPGARKGVARGQDETGDEGTPGVAAGVR